MTHLSSADAPSSPATLQQLELLRACTADLPGEISAANSAGILAWPASRLNWSRAGLMLYGVNPLEQDDHLQPVMSLKSAVFAQRWIEPGHAVGYSQTFVAQRRTRVGLVAMGYADGYPRNAPTGTPVAVEGISVPTVGRVSMDMLSVDLTDHPSLGIGSSVELWGAQVPVSQVATAAATIAYELLCNVKRVPLSYILPDRPDSVSATR
jgi:alanine racemase